MAHFINIESDREKLYQLLMLELSAKEFVCKNAIGVPEHEKLISKEQYWSYTKSIVSNFSLEISVKIRNAMDLLLSNDCDLKLKDNIFIYPIKLPEKEQASYKNLRYICNKIIHANEFQIDASGSTEKHKKLIWWSGTLTISGRERNKDWCFFLQFNQWCNACLEFLAEHEEQLEQLRLNSFDMVQRKLS